MVKDVIQLYLSDTFTMPFIFLGTGIKKKSNENNKIFYIHEAWNVIHRKDSILFHGSYLYFPRNEEMNLTRYSTP